MDRRSSHATFGFPRGRAAHAVVTTAFVLVWAIVMGALGKDDPLMQPPQREGVGPQLIPVDLRVSVVSLLLWVIALLVLSYVVGKRPRLLILSWQALAVPVICALVLTLEPWESLRWQAVEFFLDPNGRPAPALVSLLIMLLYDIARFLLKPLCVMVGLWLTCCIGDGERPRPASLAWGRLLGVSIGCGILSFVLTGLLEMVIPISLKAVQSMIVQAMSNGSDIPVRLAIWQDMLVQLVSVLAVVPALCVSPLKARTEEAEGVEEAYLE